MFSRASGWAHVRAPWDGCTVHALGNEAHCRSRKDARARTEPGLTAQTHLQKALKPDVLSGQALHDPLLQPLLQRAGVRDAERRQDGMHGHFKGPVGRAGRPSTPPLRLQLLLLQLLFQLLLLRLLVSLLPLLLQREDLLHGGLQRLRRLQRRRLLRQDLLH